MIEFAHSAFHIFTYCIIMSIFIKTMAAMVISFSILPVSCSMSGDVDIDNCPLDIIGLSLENPSLIAGTWRWVEGRMEDCSVNKKRDGGDLRFKITGDSVFVISGIFEQGKDSYKLEARAGVLGGSFLDMSDNVVLLSSGDTLIVDARFRDAGQALFVRE